METEKPLLSNEDMAVALSELHLEGLIEFRGDEAFKLTDKGLDYAFKMWEPIPPKDKVVLFYLLDLVEAIGELEKE